MSSTTLTGILELDVTQSSSGENLYIVELDTTTGESMYKLTQDYLGKFVRITIEEVPFNNEK